MRLTKKIISMFMVLLMILPTCIQAFAGTSLDDALNKVNLYVKQDKGAQLLTWKGMIDSNNFAPAVIVYKAEDGKEYPAYCANPNRPGVEDLSAKTYDVDVDQLDTDPAVWGVITNGYPYKTPQELGVNTEYEAYYATKMAVWAVVHDNYSNLDDWKANGEQNAHVEKAMKDLVAKGRANQYVYTSWLAVNPKTQNIQQDSIDSNYLSQEYSLNSNVDIKSYKVVLEGEIPSGTKITDLNNNEKDSFENTQTKFKVLIPKNSIKSDGDFNVIVKGKLENKAVMFGLSHDAGKQDYYVAPLPSYNGDSVVQLSYTATGEEPNNPEEPDNPNVPTPSKGLQILKVKEGTTEGLAGAVFKVEVDGKTIGHYVTDKNGEILIPDITGTVSITEEVPPLGYVLDENNHKDVEILNSDEPTVVTFSNEEMAELEIMKIDADTGEGLSGAAIRISLDGGNNSYDVYTNMSGTATLTNLKSGTYTVTEITAPEGYVLNDEPQSIKLEAGKKTTITLKNKAKPGIVIKKYDEDTGIPLPNAEFSVAKKGGSIIYEGMTDKEGKIKVEDLEEGWYTITEIAPPEGYLIATESKDVYLEAGKCVEVKFDNRLRPSLQIMKIDAETGEPLEGAVFKVQKTEDKTESEYVTDKTGTIVIHDLDEAVYTVTEVKSPEGYLLEEQHKDIALEWGKTKTLVFENKAKPKLEILKVDEATKEPLSGAKFRVTETEGNTTSEYVTDEEGRILIENLEAKIYTVEEITAPNGYLLEEQHKDVELEWGKTKQVVFTNKKRPSLEILKIDETTKEPLAGAKFKVTETEGNTTSEYVTDKNGRILIENLEAKIYTIEEIVAPEGYLLDEQHKDVELEWGKTKQVVFTNKKRPVLTIQKIDTKTKEPLAGAKFKVTKTEDKTVSEYVTDETGTIIINNLDEATYTVEEITAPNGYILDTQHKEIALEWGKTKTLVYENVRKPDLIITKTNMLTQKPIPNTTFKIEYEGENGSIIPLGTYKTNENGQIILKDVNVGWYIITETIPAQGFQLPSNPVTRKYLTEGENAYTSENTENNGIENQKPQKPDNSINNPTNGNVIVTSGNDYNIGEEIPNYPLNSIVIKKTDAITSEMLEGAVFEVRKVSEDISGNSGTIIGRYTTDSSGIIVITGLEAGAYIIEEVQSPNHYLISENSKQQAWLKADGTSIVEVAFANYPYGSLLITKVDGLTNQPLGGVKFKVTTGDGTVAGNTNGIYETDSNGEILIPNLKPDSYVVTEVETIENYAIDTTPQTVDIGTDGQTYRVSFKNYPYGSLLITKVDGLTNQPLGGVKFKVETSDGTVVGNTNGIYETDSNGEILIPNLKPDSYVVTEMETVENYAIDTTPQTVEIGTDGQTYKVSFKNYPYGSLLITKVDGLTNQPLGGVKFKVETSDGTVVGNTNGIYETDSNGEILIPNLKPDSYVVTEIETLENYELDTTPQTIDIETNGEVCKVSFKNQPKSSLVIFKKDADTGEPLAGVKFKVTNSDGTVIGTSNGIFTTDQNGKIVISNIGKQTVTIEEVETLEGYALETQQRTVSIDYGKTYTEEFTNKRLASLIIKKIDEYSGEPLSGVQFLVEKQNGEHIGEYTTDSTGTINVPTLEPNWYIVRELKTKDGYILDETPKTVEVKKSVPTVVTFTNKPLSGIKIIKTDSETGEPLEGVEFSISKMNGEKIGSFQTDKEGMIYVPNLEDGYYTVTETEGLEGYHYDEEPKTVEVKSGKQTIVEVENQPYSGLVIEKTNSRTGDPIEGVEFLVTKFNGEQIGYYETDEDGLIIIEGLEEGTYLVKETEAADGYQIDNESKEVEIRDGKRTVLKVENDPLSSILIHKIDSVTGEGIYGVKFLLYDGDNNPIGQYETDNEGYIYINKELPEGKYKIRELEPADGYISDNEEKTFYLKKGKTTEITWENTPQMGQIQITKKSSDDNPYNGFPAGTLLEGATFEIYDRANNLLDTIVSDKNGIAVSKPLPLGRYIIRETKAPNFYEANSNVIEAEIEFVGQIVRLEVLNSSLYTNVSIKKRGYEQVAPNQSIRYEFSDIKNNSTVSLNSFYWRDTLPAEAVRLDKIITGTYNQRLSYKIVYKTNLMTDYRTLADNLDTAKNNVIAASPAALGLPSNEYVTEIMFVFGTVKSGFSQVETPYIYCNVLPNAYHEQRFTNNADVGGLNQNQWIMSNDRWVTVVYAKQEPQTLPRTGY